MLQHIQVSIFHYNTIGLCVVSIEIWPSADSIYFEHYLRVLVATPIIWKMAINYICNRFYSLLMHFCICLAGPLAPELTMSNATSTTIADWHFHHTTLCSAWDHPKSRCLPQCCAVHRVLCLPSLDRRYSHMHTLVAPVAWQLGQNICTYHAALDCEAGDAVAVPEEADFVAMESGHG